MFIPAGHVRPFVPFGKFSDRIESATRNGNMFIPVGHVRPFVPFGKFSDRNEFCLQVYNMFSPPVGHGILLFTRTV